MLAQFAKSTQATPSRSYSPGPRSLAPLLSSVNRWNPPAQAGQQPFTPQGVQNFGKGLLSSFNPMPMLRHPVRAVEQNASLIETLLNPYQNTDKLKEMGRGVQQNPAESLGLLAGMLVGTKGLGASKLGRAGSLADRAASYPAPAQQRTQWLGRHADLAENVLANKDFDRTLSNRARTSKLAEADRLGVPFLPEPRAIPQSGSTGGFKNLKYNVSGSTEGVRIPGLSSKKPLTEDPMEGKYFSYTGKPAWKSVRAKLDVLRRRHGPESEEYKNAYEGAYGKDDEFMGGYAADDWGPENVHNIQDKKGNTIGSMTWDELVDHPNFPGGIFDAREMYLRPEYRNIANIRKLAEPMMKTNKTVDASFANADLARLFERLVKKGKVKTTDSPLDEDNFGHFKNPQTGRYDFEIHPSKLPQLMGMEPRLTGRKPGPIKYGDVSANARDTLPAFWDYMGSRGGYKRGTR